MPSPMTCTVPCGSSAQVHFGSPTDAGFDETLHGGEIVGQFADELRAMHQILESVGKSWPDASGAFHGIRELGRMRRRHRDDLSAQPWTQTVHDTQPDGGVG